MGLLITGTGTAGLGLGWRRRSLPAGLALGLAGLGWAVETCWLGSPPAVQLLRSAAAESARSWSRLGLV